MTIKKLTINDHEKVEKLFGENIENFNFILMDLLKNKYENLDFEVYGEFESNALVSILMNNCGSLVYYSINERGVEVYKELIETLNFYKVSGPSNLIEKFFHYIDVNADEECNLSVVKEINAKSRYSNIDVKYIQNRDEIERLYYLFKSTEEYQNVVTDKKEEFIESELLRLEESLDRTAYIEVDGEMVASCATRNETTKSAVIIGVVTSTAQRNKGYGTEVLIGLFNKLLEEGKLPYIFHNNPVAARVYKNLGATEVCKWRVVFIK